MSITPADVALYHIYQYCYIDDFSCIKDPVPFFKDGVWAEWWPAFKDALEERFMAHGWEGDGTIGMIWIPPFIDAGVEDGIGFTVWHVKQDNNGVSFLASKYPLPFQRLREQNE